MSDSGPDLDGVDVDGPRDAPELVFVHGVMFTRKQWAPQRDALSEQFRVIAPDLPAHGDRSDEPFDMESAVAVVDDAIEDVADGRAHLVGISLGGYVATEYASRYPEKVESLVLSGSSANPVGPTKWFTLLVSGAAHLATRSGLVNRGVRWAAKRWVERRDLPRGTETEIQEAGFYPEPSGKAGFELAGTDFRSKFADYPGPALVVNGRWDLVMRLGEDAHAAAGDAEVAIFERTGHVVNLESPAAFTDELRRFVSTDPVAAGV